MNVNDDNEDEKPIHEAAFDLTTAQTDTETGNEKLDGEEDRKRSVQALKTMYAKGLLSDREYQDRLKELKKGD